MIVVHNPSDAPVKDYPIQDPKGGDVLLWSILPGETLEFPDYVANYLLSVYAFLQKVMTEEQFKQEKEEEEKIRSGQVFTQVKIVNAEGKPVEEKKQETGFTNANMQPHNAPVADPNPETVPAQPPVKTKNIEGEFACPAEGCGQKFKKEQHLKVHYALKHFQMPS